MRKKIILIAISVAMLLCLVACSGAKTPDEASSSSESITGIWKDALYTEDTELGKGSKTVNFEVTADGKTVGFTVHTDKNTVGDALLETDLISGDDGEYGLYVKKVNGILADYDVNACYWAFYVNGELAMTGVDGADIDESAVYRFEYAK